MSTPRYRIPPKLIASLHERGLTVESLAKMAGTGRTHATQVLAGVPGRGGHTRRKLAPWLTFGELDLLNWSIEGSLLSPSWEPLHVERSKFSITNQREARRDAATQNRLVGPGSSRSAVNHAEPSPGWNQANRGEAGKGGRQ